MEVFVYVFITAFVIFRIYSTLKSYNFDIKPLENCAQLFDIPGKMEFRKLLEENFIVYRMLGEKGRKIFEKRVCRFIRMKKFRAGSSIELITDEMRVMVAGAAIQITFGYPNVYFRHFETIILFADEYYSTISGRYHKGEVNAGGAIVLSWRSFLSGFSNPSDGHNLALHEMAHALRLSNIVEDDEYDFLDRKTMKEFESIALAEMQKIERGENIFFRSYGAANLQEFFSVAVECFFEQSNEFHTYNPDLYILLSRILKIDLLNFDWD